LHVLDQEFFRDVALFLNTYNNRSVENFAESLNDLRTGAFPEAEGLFTVPGYVDELVRMLEALYQQYDDRYVGYLRGAILERLAFQLILATLSFR